MTIADVEPSTGRLCAGTWNRNSGSGIADYTTCNATFKTGTAYITASADGASSNPLPVYVHPTVTSVVLGPPSTNCATDPATNCSPAAYSTSATSCTVNPANGCCTTPLPTSTAYVQNACLSQGTTGQLAARVYAGTGAGQTNISCQVGHPSYLAQTASVVTIDENGVATAQAPGSTIITANLSNAGSSAGFFSTCPPVSIDLTVPITGGTRVSVNPNNPQPLNTIVKDMNGTILTGLTLEYVSTTPTTIPGNSTITPLFPGTAGITAICQPPSCNPSPFNQIGLFGNGTPIISNELTVKRSGQEQHRALHRQHAIAIHRSSGLHDQRGGSSDTLALCAQLHRHQQRRSVNLHGQRNRVDDLQRPDQRSLERRLHRHGQGARGLSR